MRALLLLPLATHAVFPFSFKKWGLPFPFPIFLLNYFFKKYFTDFILAEPPFLPGQPEGVGAGSLVFRFFPRGGVDVCAGVCLCRRAGNTVL